MKKSLLIACLAIAVSTYIYGGTTTRNFVQKTTDSNSVTYETQMANNKYKCTKTTDSKKTEQFTCTINNGKPLADSKFNFDLIESIYNN